jgi:hypothetical protein
MAFGNELFNQSAYEKKKESVKAEPIPGFGSYTRSDPVSKTFKPSQPQTFTNVSNDYYSNWKAQSSYGRSGLDRVFDALQVGQYAVAGGVRGFIKRDGWVFNPFTIGSRTIDALGGVIGGLRAANPLGKGFEEGEASFTDVFSEMGWNPTSKLGKVARGVVGFAGDVLLDPLTYVSGGTSAFLKGTQTTAKVGAKVSAELTEKFGREVAEKLAKKAAANAGKGLTHDIARKTLFDMGESITEKSIDDFIKRVNKLAGVGQSLGDNLSYGIGKHKKVVVNEDVLRMLGDKTVAPYINSIPNIIQNNGVFKKLDNRAAIKTLAKYDIGQTARTLAAQDIRNRHSVSLAKGIVSSKRKMAKLGAGLTKDQQLRIVDILDDTDLWREKLVTTGLIDNEFGRKLITKYSKELDESTKLVDYYDDLVRQKSTLVDDEDKLISAMSKLERGNATAELNKAKEFRALLVDNQKKIKQSLFDINNEAKDQIAKQKVVQYRNKYNVDGKFLNTPYGFRKAGDILRGADNTSYSFNDYLNKPMSDISKGYATSSKSVNTFLEVKRGNETMYNRLSDVINKNSVLKNDFDMMPLRTSLTDDQLKKALDVYANGTADEFFDYSKTLREGYDEAKSIAEVELDEKLVGLADLTGDDLTKATKKAQTEKFQRIDELIINEPERLDLFIKNIDKSDALIKTSKQKAAKGKNWNELVDKRKKLESQLTNDTISNEGIVELAEINKIMSERNFKLSQNNLMTKAQVDATDMYSTLSKSEVENILRSDYPGGFTRAQRHAEFDPWEDIDNISQKAGDTEVFSEALLEGSDLIKPYNDSTTKAFTRAQYDADDLDILYKSDDELEKLIDEFELGDGKSIGQASPMELRKAAAFDKVTENTMRPEILDEFADSADLLKSKKYNRAKKLADQLRDSNKAKASYFDGNLNDLFKQTQQENIDAITDKTIKAAKEKNYAQGVIDSQKAKAKTYDITIEQVRNLEDYLNIDFDSVVRQLNGIDKKQVRSYKRSVMKKYFPDKKLKDLSKAEKEIIEDIMEDGVKTGVIPQIDYDVFYDELLERTNVKISELDDISEAIEVNLQKTKEGYWVQNKKISQKIEAIDETLQNPVFIRNIDEAKKLRIELGEAFRDNKLDDYARSQLGESYNQYVNWKTVPGTELADDLLLESDAPLVDAIKNIRKELEFIGNSEQSNKIKSYFPHIVKQKHRDLFNNYVDLVEDAVVGSDGRPFVANQLQRKWEGSIKQFEKSWDDYVIKNSKPPTFKDVFGNDSGNFVPRDLFEDDLVSALTERAIRHDNYLFDKKNANTVWELVTREYSPTKLLIGTDVPVIPKEDLIKFFRGSVPEGQVLTSGFINDSLEGLGIKVNYNSEDLYAEITQGADRAFGKVGEDGKRVFKVGAMDDNVRQHFNKTSKYQKAENVQKVLDVYDKFLHLWKLNVTVVNPSFHSRNALGNSFNSYLDIGAKSFSFKERKRIASIMSGTSDELISGFDADELMQIATQLDVLDTGQFGFEIRQLMESSKVTNSKWAKFDPRSTTEFIPYKAGTKVGSYIENLDKMLNFVHHLEKGVEPKLAAEMTNKFLFDYKNATVFEKEVLRRAIPFWTWGKKNIPLQMEQVIKHPEKYRPFVKGLQALDRSNTGDENISFERGRDAGEFAEDWVSLPGTGEAGVNIFNPNLPFQDLSLSVKDLIGRLSPFLKAPVELALDYDSYYGTELNSKLGHIAKQIGPLSNAMKLGKKEGYDRRLELLAQLTGLRFLNYDREKFNYRKVLNELERDRR